MSATLVIAVAGLAIASVNAGWTIYVQGFRDRSGVRLRDWPTTLIGDGNHWVFSVDAANTGRRPITIEGGGLELPDDRWLAFTAANPQLPARLQEGEKVMMWAKHEGVLSGLTSATIPTHMIVRDSTGRQHRKRLSSRSKRWFRKELADLVAERGSDDEGDRAED